LLTSGNLTKLSEKGGRPFYTSISSSNIQIERTSPFLTEYDPQRIVFSEYHAYGAPSGSFMLRQDNYKFNYYVGFEPELFDLNQDPQELNNLSAEKSQADRVRDFENRLRELLDPEEIDEKAKADQARLVEEFGGVERALKSGTKAETPAPSTE
jgi:choline-sulfatase